MAVAASKKGKEVRVCKNCFRSKSGVGPVIKLESISSDDSQTQIALKSGTGTGNGGAFPPKAASTQIQPRQSQISSEYVPPGGVAMVPSGGVAMVPPGGVAMAGIGPAPTRPKQNGPPKPVATRPGGGPGRGFPPKRGFIPGRAKPGAKRPFSGPKSGLGPKEFVPPKRMVQGGKAAVPPPGARPGLPKRGLAPMRRGPPPNPGRPVPKYSRGPPPAAVRHRPAAEPQFDAPQTAAPVAPEAAAPEAPLVQAPLPPDSVAPSPPILEASEAFADSLQPRGLRELLEEAEALGIPTEYAECKADVVTLLLENHLAPEAMKDMITLCDELGLEAEAEQANDKTELCALAASKLAERAF